MRNPLLALQVAALLFLAHGSMAATVDYQHPELTIVAKDEPLDEVLESLGREMRIFVKMPTGFNPLVSCDIQQQLVEKALKKLLAGVSYSLEWDSGSEHLSGVTILSAGGAAEAASAPVYRSVPPSSGEHAAATGGGTSQSSRTQAAAGRVENTGTPPASSRIESGETERAARDTAMADHEARMLAAREEHQARMTEVRAVQEERMLEQRANYEAETAAYLESQGIDPQ